MNTRILLALYASDITDEYVFASQYEKRLNYPGFDFDLKIAVAQPLERIKKNCINLFGITETGKIHKIVFEYARNMGYDFVIVTNPQQYHYLQEHLNEVVAPLNKSVAYLTGGDTANSQFGLINYVQQKVFNKQLNLFPKIAVYNTEYLAKIPYLFNSNDASFVNEVAIQIVLSDFSFVEVKSNFKSNISYRTKLQTLAVFFRAYLHSLGVFYQNKFDIIPNNLQYSLKLGYASSHTYAIEAVPHGSKVIDIGAGPYGVGHQLKKTDCSVVTVDQFDIPEQYKLDKHIVANLDSEFSIPVTEYDCILFLDIIEHITNPEGFMFELSKQFSHKKQKVILTTGNIAFFPMRLILLLGYFNYGKSGILDKTHTRLFSFSSFKKLITDSGLKIVSVKGIPAPYPKALGDNFVARFLLAANLFFIKISKGFFSYQIYIEAETVPSVLYIVEENKKTYLTDN